MNLLNRVSLESVDFQSTTFFKELTNAFTELQLEKKDASESPVVQQLSEIIRRHTGMNIEVRIDEYDPCIEIPHVDKNHPLVNDYWRNYINSNDGLALINKAGSAVRGTVNTKTGKVTGIFTELKGKTHLHRDMFATSRFLAEEIAAVTLHEVGHLFTYFEYITRTVTTNQVLAGVAKALDGAGTIEEREAVFISAKQALKLSELDEKALAKSNNKKVAEVVILTNVARQVESELGSNIYDFSTWEMLADQYASRYGAYRPLVTALAKYYRGVYHRSFRSTVGFLAMEALKLVAIIHPLLFVLLVAMDGAGDGTYDEPGARFKRVRNQIVENLKDKKLSKDDHERLMTDLAAIDDVLKSVNDRRQLMGVIYDNVVPSARKAYRQEKLQQDLEQLAMNDLFVKASELRQLA